MSGVGERELQSIENGCKLRSMRPLVIGVDIATAVVVVSAFVLCRSDERAALRPIECRAGSLQNNDDRETAGRYGLFLLPLENKLKLQKNSVLNFDQIHRGSNLIAEFY